MKTFIVNVKEVHNLPVPVEANTPEEAKSKVEDMLAAATANYDVLEYSHTMPPTSWNVEEKVETTPTPMTDADLDKPESDEPELNHNFSDPANGIPHCIYCGCDEDDAYVGGQECVEHKNRPKK